jgi:pyridoxamine 5'-phosphate oxidase
MRSIADLRQDYRQSHLLESEALPDAMAQFQRWFDQAVAAEINEPNAMTLATVSPEGIPTARIVLLKGIDHGDFVFYTSYLSRKAQDIEHNPNVALNFFWLPIERQVCIRGVARKASREEAQQYFQSRPIGSQLGAWASRQSSVIDSRDVLENEMARLEQEYQGRTIPLPDFWGGYRIKPQTLEFWQGRTGRLHDRLRYTRQADESWQIERLSP